LLGKMVVIRGIARDPTIAPVVTVKGEAAPAPVGHFMLDGRSVWLEDFGPDPLAGIHDGDEVVLAGHDRGGAFTASAVRNLTQHRAERSAITADSIWGTVSLIFGLSAIWLSVIFESQLPELIWVGRIAFGAVGVLMVLVAASYAASVGGKYRATYLVNAATLEIIRGTAADVRHIVWTDPSAQFARFTLAGRSIRFVESRLLALSDGDDIVIAGQPSTEGPFVAFAMYNITQGRSERGWDRWTQFETFLLVIFGLVVPPGLFFSTPAELNLFIALRYIFIVGLATFAVTAWTARFYAWKFDREALRRVHEAGGA
jgi:hypothetical protein